MLRDISYCLSILISPFICFTTKPNTNTLYIRNARIRFIFQYMNCFLSSKWSNFVYTFFWIQEKRWKNINHPTLFSWNSRNKLMKNDPPHPPLCRKLRSWYTREVRGQIYSSGGQIYTSGGQIYSNGGQNHFNFIKRNFVLTTFQPRLLSSSSADFKLTLGSNS